MHIFKFLSSHGGKKLIIAFETMIVENEQGNVVMRKGY